MQLEALTPLLWSLPSQAKDRECSLPPRSSHHPIDPSYHSCVLPQEEGQSTHPTLSTLPLVDSHGDILLSQKQLLSVASGTKETEHSQKF